MREAKINLSPKEMELVTNAGWILTKNRIIGKAKMLLGELQEKNSRTLLHYAEWIPKEIPGISPKISKGENYNGLPYLILDYPRVFSKKDIFAIRIMIWWGNFFSITLQLSGKYKKENEKKIASAFKILKNNHFYYCIHESEWEHHFDSSNYLPINDASQKDFESFMTEKAFIKIARKIPLLQWDNAVERLSADFKLLIKILSA